MLRMVVSPDETDECGLPGRSRAQRKTLGARDAKDVLVLEERTPYRPPLAGRPYSTRFAHSTNVGSYPLPRSQSASA